MILSHAWLPGNSNRWQWDKLAFREIVHFGKWMFLSSILGFLVNSGDRLLLGGLVNSNNLGIFSIAYLIPNSVEQIPGKIMADVSLPALSEVARDRPTDLKSTYYRFHVAIAFIRIYLLGRSYDFWRIARPLTIRCALRASGLDAGNPCCRFAYSSLPPCYPILPRARNAASSFNSNCNSVGYPLHRHTYRVLFLWNCLAHCGAS